MKIFKSFFKLLIAFVAFFLIFNQTYNVPLFLNQVYAEESENSENSDPEIFAESAIVMDFGTGEILWGKNESKLMYPASATKILTAIISIENIKNYEEVVSITEGDLYDIYYYPFFFFKGDSIKIIDLLKATLICSHNNATDWLAKTVSGDVEKFVELMNIKAKEIGAENTTFYNTNGFDDKYPEHLTTAQDLAVITRYCLGNDLFKEIVKTKQDTVTIIDANSREIKVEIKNTNDLLRLEYIQGVKTGYTSKAGYCVIVFAKKNDMDLIVVILKSTQDERENDTIKILNYVYNNYRLLKIVDSSKIFLTKVIDPKQKIKVNLYPEKDYTSLIKNNAIIELEHQFKEKIGLPIYRGQVLGTIDIYVNKEKKESINLVSIENINVIKSTTKSLSIVKENDVVIKSNKDNRNFLIAFLVTIPISLIIIFLLIRKHSKNK